MSTLPILHLLVRAAVSTPAAAASWVIISTSVKRPSRAPRVEPGLNPNQPSQRIRTPSPNRGIECPGIARGFPSAPYLPFRAPSRSSTARAPVAPIRWTAVEPAKSCMPMFACSQPPPNTQWAPIG
jgi:hypothetical protein